LESLENEFQIRSPLEWYRVALTDLREIVGGNVFTTNRALVEFLAKFYPKIKWKESKFNVSQTMHKKSTQRKIVKSLSVAFPGHLIYEEFKHKEAHLLRAIELDIYLPSLAIALEYQGFQHYEDTILGTAEMYNSRDDVKRVNCEKFGITLLEVPFWEQNYPRSSNIPQFILLSRPDLRECRVTENG